MCDQSRADESFAFWIRVVKKQTLFDVVMFFRCSIFSLCEVIPVLLVTWTAFFFFFCHSNFGFEHLFHSVTQLHRPTGTVFPFLPKTAIWSKRSSQTMSHFDQNKQVLHIFFWSFHSIFSVQLRKLLLNTSTRYTQLLATAFAAVSGANCN